MLVQLRKKTTGATEIDWFTFEVDAGDHLEAAHRVLRARHDWLTDDNHTVRIEWVNSWPGAFRLAVFRAKTDTEVPDAVRQLAARYCYSYDAGSRWFSDLFRPVQPYPKLPAGTFRWKQNPEAPYRSNQDIRWAAFYYHDGRVLVRRQRGKGSLHSKGRGRFNTVGLISLEREGRLPIPEAFRLALDEHLIERCSRWAGRTWPITPLTKAA